MKRKSYTILLVAIVFVLCFFSVLHETTDSLTRRSTRLNTSTKITLTSQLKSSTLHRQIPFLILGNRLHQHLPQQVRIRPAIPLVATSMTATSTVLKMVKMMPTTVVTTLVPVEAVTTTAVTNMATKKPRKTTSGKMMAAIHMTNKTQHPWQENHLTQCAVG